MSCRCNETTLGAAQYLDFPMANGVAVDDSAGRSTVTLDFPFLEAPTAQPAGPVAITPTGQVTNYGQGFDGLGVGGGVSPLVWVGGGVLLLALVMKRR